MKKTLTHPRGKARDEELTETALNVGVPSTLHTRIRVRAAQERVTVKELVTAGMEWFLEATKTPRDSAAS